MQDEKKPTTSHSPSPIPDTGIPGNVPTVTGKENLQTISELPPVKVLEGLGSLVEVEKQPGDQIVVEGLPSPFEQVGENVQKPISSPVQSVTQVPKGEKPETPDTDQNVIPFIIKAKGDPTDAEVDEAKIKVREEDRELEAAA